VRLLQVHPLLAGEPAGPVVAAIIASMNMQQLYLQLTVVPATKVAGSTTVACSS
jgi:hypothetical protein